MLVGGEAGDRLEVIVLKEIEEDVAIMEIANARLRELLRIVTPRARRTGSHDDHRCGHRGQNAQPGSRWNRTAHEAYSQSLISNSGCCLRCRSLILSSRYLAPMPFSNERLAPRL